MQDGTTRSWLGRYNGPHEDLREFLARAEQAGEVVHVANADWDLEMGALSEAVVHKKTEAPMLVFDEIPDYPKGFRAVSGTSNSSKRIALALGFPEPRSPTDLVQAYRDRMKHHAPIPPIYLETGPILENIDRDAEVDLWKFPVPRLHEEDGGRYIGTDDLVIMRDPDGRPGGGWINCATYRAQVHGRDTLGLWISPGKQGRQIRDKYFKQGKPCPVLICCGHDPLLFLAANHEVRYGVSELDYAAGHRGRPFEVIASELHGLPMPAHAEIVLEGEIHPTETLPEGPFGEFTGYYASAQSEQPVVHVRRVYHRDDPILTMASPMRPPTDITLGKCIVKSGMIWDELERAGLAGIAGIWCHEAGVARLFNVIALRQAYEGHAKQALLIASGCQSGAYVGRFTVVVDHDVDPTDMFAVMWAICTRCDPAGDIDIVRNMWSSPLDPISSDNMSSRAMIDACRPFGRLKTFPKVAEASPELRAKVAAKFSAILDAI